MLIVVRRNCHPLLQSVCNIYNSTREVRAIQFLHKAPAFVTLSVFLLVSAQLFLHSGLFVMTHEQVFMWCCQLCILISWKALVFLIFNWVAWVLLFLPFWTLFLYSLDASVLLHEACRHSHNPQVIFTIPNKIISYKLSQIVRNPFWGSSAWSQPKNSF